MIIRSQNKKELHNLDRISNIRVFQLNNGEAIVEVNWQHSIGRYSTEEKAVKVLDIICEKAFVQANVFQMPQDSEV